MVRLKICSDEVMTNPCEWWLTFWYANGQWCENGEQLRSALEEWGARLVGLGEIEFIDEKHATLFLLRWA
jgi:hypothetical protein